MKRFWDAAEASPEGEGFTVRLDGRPVRLPGGTPLLVSSRPLAEALVAEWHAAGGAKGGEFSLAELPLTRMVGTAIERIAPDPKPTVDAIAAYGASDLLCYRAEDRKLAALQAEQWSPLLDWAALTLDAPLRVTSGVIHVEQDPGALAALRRAVAARPPITLSALGVVVPALGSLVLGLALAARRLDAAEAHRLATLDETYQEAFWGADAEALARRARIADEIILATRLMGLSEG